MPYPQSQSGSPPREVDSPSLHNGTWQWRIWLYWSEVGLLEQASITFRIGNTDVHLVDPPVTKPYIIHYGEEEEEHDITWNANHDGWVYQYDNQLWYHTVSGKRVDEGWSRTCITETEGNASLVWDGTDEYGNQMPAGIYTLNVKTFHWKSDWDETVSRFVTVHDVTYEGAETGQVEIRFGVHDPQGAIEVPPRRPRLAVVDVYDLAWHLLGSISVADPVLLPDENVVPAAIPPQESGVLAVVVTVYDSRNDRNHHQDKYAIKWARSGANLDVTQTIAWVPAAYITQLESVQGNTVTVKHSEGFPPAGFMGIGWSRYRYERQQSGGLEVKELVQGEPVGNQKVGEIVYLDGTHYANCNWDRSTLSDDMPHITVVSAEVNLDGGGYVRFELKDASHYVGYCSNVASGIGSDLSLVPLPGAPAVIISGAGKTAVTQAPVGKGGYARIGVMSYDFGAWGVLKAQLQDTQSASSGMPALVDLATSRTNASLDRNVFYPDADTDANNITECRIPADYGAVHIEIGDIDDNTIPSHDRITLAGGMPNELSDYWELEKERDWRKTYSHWDGAQRKWNTSGRPQDPDFSNLSWDEEPNDPDWMPRGDRDYNDYWYDPPPDPQQGPWEPMPVPDGPDDPLYAGSYPSPPHTGTGGDFPPRQVQVSIAPHATSGDALTVLEEYRGFQFHPVNYVQPRDPSDPEGVVLSGSWQAPAPPQANWASDTYVRLTPVRKELLVEVDYQVPVGSEDWKTGTSSNVTGGPDPNLPDRRVVSNIAWQGGNPLDHELAGGVATLWWQVGQVWQQWNGIVHDNSSTAMTLLPHKKLPRDTPIPQTVTVNVSVRGMADATALEVAEAMHCVACNFKRTAGIDVYYVIDDAGLPRVNALADTHILGEDDWQVPGRVAQLRHRMPDYRDDYDGSGVPPVSAARNRDYRRFEHLIWGSQVLVGLEQSDFVFHASGVGVRPERFPTPRPREERGCAVWWPHPFPLPIPGLPAPPAPPRDPTGLCDYQENVYYGTHELGHTVRLEHPDPDPSGANEYPDEPWVMNYWGPWRHWQDDHPAHPPESRWWQQDFAQQYQTMDFSEVKNINVKDHYTVAP